MCICVCVRNCFIHHDGSEWADEHRNGYNSRSLASHTHNGRDKEDVDRNIKWIEIEMNDDDADEEEQQEKEGFLFGSNIKNAQCLNSNGIAIFVFHTNEHEYSIYL